jgi:ribosomal protein S7
MKFAKRSFGYNRLKKKYNSIFYFNYLIGCFIKKGFKFKSILLIKNFLLKLKKLYKIKNINFFFFSIISRYIPVISFLNKKVVGVVYMLPFYINKQRSICLFLKWFSKSVYQRKEIFFIDRLVNEFKEIILGYGKTVQKLIEYYNLAVKNKPFLRYLYKNKKGSKLLLQKYSYKLKYKLK